MPSDATKKVSIELNTNNNFIVKIRDQTQTQDMQTKNSTFRKP